MEQKLKRILWLALAVVLVGGAAVYFLGKYDLRKQPLKSKNTENVARRDDSSQKSEPVSVIRLSGTVSKISADTIEIQNGEVKNTLSMKPGVTVISTLGEKPEKKSLAEVKAGQKVELDINQKNSSVILIRITPDSGENKSLAI